MQSWYTRERRSDGEGFDHRALIISVVGQIRSCVYRNPRTAILMVTVELKVDIRGISPLPAWLSTAPTVAVNPLVVTRKQELPVRRPELEESGTAVLAAG